MINIYDKLLIVVLIVVAISFNFALNKFFFNEEASPLSSGKVIVSINNEIKATFDVSENDSYKIVDGNSFNTIKIQDGFVKMIDANCNDKLCLSQREIHNNFETIICLPHRLVIEIENNIESELDSIAQ